jgi:ribosomal protein S18 acetylase RimI-like enzyme
MREIEIIEQTVEDLAAYGAVPIAFEVRTVFEVQVVDRGLGGFVLAERKHEHPWVKDYDACAEDAPAHWAAQWDLSNWGALAAFVNGVRAGGCVLAYDTPGVNMLEGREDLAVLWDIRVHPDYRGRGVGLHLFRAAEAWARHRRCRVLKIETQNINVPACRFYARQGAILGAIHRHAYADFPDEVQMLWYQDLEEAP